METKKQLNLSFRREVAKVDKNGRVKVGRCWVKSYAIGSFTVYGRGIPKTGFYIPNPTKLKEKAEREIERRGAISRSTYDSIRNAGLLHSKNQRRSVESGAAFLGIEDLKTPSDARRDKFLRRADKHFRRFWKKREVEGFMRDPIAHPLKGIKDFRHEYPNDYKWIKCYSDMHDFMEERRPGLYRFLSERTNQDTVNIQTLGRELKRAITSGIPVSRAYLLESTNPRRRKWFWQVDYALKHNLLPKRFKKFEEALSCLTEIPESEIRANALGAKQCGKLAEKYVNFYLVWAVRSGFDPLKLDLPDLSEMSFDYDKTRFTYAGDKKGWSDARVGNKAIEVKVGTFRIAGHSLAELIDKYGGESQWMDKEPMEGATLFIHQEPRFYQKALPKLEEKGIKVIGFDEFHSALVALIDNVENKYSNIFENSYPHINKSALLEAHTNLNLETRLRLFSRPGFETQRNWYTEMLKYLIKSAEY